MTCHPSSEQRPLTLQQFVLNIERTTNDFTALLLQVREHQANITKERVKLGEIRDNLSRLREPLHGWEKALWDGMWRDDVDRAGYRKAEFAVRSLDTKIGDLIWELFEFRRKERQS